MYVCISIYIYMYICTYIHIKVNCAINRIHEKVFRSDLSTQIKNLSFDELLIMNYFFLLFTCTW